MKIGEIAKGARLVFESRGSSPAFFFEGLRHVGYGVPTEYFPPMVQAYCEAGCCLLHFCNCRPLTIAHEVLNACRHFPGFMS